MIFIFFCLGYYHLVVVFTALCQYCFEKKSDRIEGDILIKFTFSLDLEDILPQFFKGYWYQLIVSYFPMTLV